MTPTRLIELRTVSKHGPILGNQLAEALDEIERLQKANFYLRGWISGGGWLGNLPTSIEATEPWLDKIERGR